LPHGRVCRPTGWTTRSKGFSVRAVSSTIISSCRTCVRGRPGHEASRCRLTRPPATTL